MFLSLVKNLTILALIVFLSFTSAPVCAETLTDFPVSPELKQILETAKSLPLVEQDANAKDLLKKYTSEHPEDPLGFFYLGNVLMNLGNFPESLGEYGNTLANAPDLAEAHAQSSSALLMIADSELSSAATETIALAIKAAETAVSLAPGRADFHSLQATAYIRINDFMSAQGALKRALRLEPLWIMDWYRLGVTYFQTGAFHHAADAFETARLLCNPKNPRAVMPREDLYDIYAPFYNQSLKNISDTHVLIQKANALSDQGKPEEAMEEYKNILQKTSDSADAYFKIGLLYLKEPKDNKSARNYFEKSLDQNPLHINARLDLCYLPDNTGAQDTEAELAPEANTENKKTIREEDELVKAACYKEMAITKNIIELKKTIQYEPENMEFLQEIVSNLLQLGLTDEARPYFAAAQLQSPDSPWITKTAVCFTEQGCE